MADTVKIKHSDSAGNDHLVIDRADYDPSKHELFGDDNGDGTVSTEESELLRRKEMERRAEANRGITGGPSIVNDGRNPSGTFSEPTPTDIRFPNKDETEFENNHGAFVGKSAAQMREAEGLPDAPGGLAPDAAHVGKGPRGKWYVKHGTARTAGPFETEEEAKAALASDDKPDAEQLVEQDEAAEKPLLDSKTV